MQVAASSRDFSLNQFGHNLKRLTVILVFASVSGILEPVAFCQNIGVGTAITHPEKLTGIWETALGSGKTFGLSIALIATVPRKTDKLSNAEQTIRFLRVISYVRDGAGSTRTLWDTGISSRFAWHNNRIHSEPLQEKFGSIDLLFSPSASSWTGTIKSTSFSGTVTLRRPRIDDQQLPTGVWYQEQIDRDEMTCLHVASDSEQRMLIWADYLTFGNLTQYANGLHAPARTDESYGEFQNDPQEQKHGSQWSFRVGNGMGGDVFTGTLSDDGMVFSGTSRHFGNGLYDPRHPDRAFIWRKTPRDSCPDR